MVGGDLVAEQAQDAGTLDIGDAGAALAHADEVGRVLDIGRIVVPGVGLARRNLHGLPVDVALEDVSILALVQFAGDVFQDEFLDFVRGRPDVLEEHRIAILVFAERFTGQVDLHRARQRVGDDQRRRCEVVRLHIRRHATFEIAVAGKNAGCNQALVVDCLGDRRRQRAGIANAGGAAEADEIEAERVEIGLQAGLRQVFGNDLATGCQRCLYPGL